MMRYVKWSKKYRPATYADELRADGHVDEDGWVNIYRGVPGVDPNPAKSISWTTDIAKAS